MPEPMKTVQSYQSPNIEPVSAFSRACGQTPSPRSCGRLTMYYCIALDVALHAVP